MYHCATTGSVHHVNNTNHLLQLPAGHYHTHCQLGQLYLPGQPLAWKGTVPYRPPGQGTACCCRTQQTCRYLLHNTAVNVSAHCAGRYEHQFHETLLASPVALGGCCSFKACLSRQLNCSAACRSGRCNLELRQCTGQVLHCRQITCSRQCCQPYWVQWTCHQLAVSVGGALQAHDSSSC